LFLLVICGKPLRMSTRILAIALAAFVLTLFSLPASEFPDAWTWDKKPEARASHAALEGKPMPALSAVGWINGQPTSADLKGKVVVLDFYATWCGPCMKAIPHNNEMLKNYKSKGLTLLGICTSDRGQEKYAANAKEHGVQYPVARDPQGKTAQAYRASYFPTYVVIDRKGIVRAIGLQPQYVETVVKKLLAEPVS